MNYELAKELKNAGFPQHSRHFAYNPEGIEIEWDNCCGYWGQAEDDLDCIRPTLSELIEACPKPLQITVMPNDFTTACYFGGQGLCNQSLNLEEAVARLWLALNQQRVSPKEGEQIQ